MNPPWRDDNEDEVKSLTALVRRVVGLVVLISAMITLAACGATSEQEIASPDELAPVGAVSSCDPNYTNCVPLVEYDLDCADISRAVEVIGTDVHRFDADGDGYGCESYG